MHEIWRKAPWENNASENGKSRLARRPVQQTPFEILRQFDCVLVCTDLLVCILPFVKLSQVPAPLWKIFVSVLGPCFRTFVYFVLGLLVGAVHVP